ncbi:MAG: hypothetical protein RR190_04945 [Bacteroidales bacterium]
MEDTLINIGLYLTYALFIIAIIALLFFSIRQFFGNIAKSKETLYGIIGLVVIFVISYIAASSTNVSETLFQKVGTDYALSKLIGSGLNMFYILFVGVILTLVGSELSRPFKK